MMRISLKTQILPGVGLLLLYLVLAPAMFICLDEDPYIFFRFIDNFIAGNGLVFNAGDRLQGFDNFLWVSLLFPFQLASISPAIVSRLLGMLLILAVAWRIVCFTRKLTNNNHFFSWAAAYWYLLGMPVLWWSQCGMGTSLASLVILNTVYYSLYGSHKRLWGGFWLVASILTRPEAIMLIPLYGYFLLRNYRWQDALKGFCWVLLVIIFYHALKYGYYGQILSNPAYVKAGGSFHKGLVHLREFFFSGAYAVGLPFFIFALWGKKYFIKNLPLALVVFAYMFFNLYVGGDYKPHYRFVVPLIAPFMIVSAYGTYRITEHLKSNNNAVFSVRILFIVLIAINVLSYQGLGERAWQTFKNGLTNWPDRVVLQAQTTENNYDFSYMPYLGKWIRKNFPPGTLIAYEQMGEVPYFSGIEYEYIDFGGLEDRFVAQYYRNRRTDRGIPRFFREFLNCSTLHKMPDLWDRVFSKFSKKQQAEPQDFIDYILQRKPEIIMNVGHITTWNPVKRLYSNPAFREQYHLAQSFGFRPGVYVMGEVEHDISNTIMFFRRDLDADALSKAKCLFEESSHDDFYHYTDKEELTDWTRRKFPELVGAIR